MASRNGALYLKDGHTVEVKPARLFRDMHLLHVPGGGDFEAYPNRDSLAYREIYNLGDQVRTVFRATLRNMGWCDTLFNIGKIGLLDDQERDGAGLSCAQYMGELLGAGPDEDLRTVAAARMGIAPDGLPAWNLHWLGMFSDRPVGRPRVSPLDLLGDVMLEKLVYAPGERDMVVAVPRVQGLVRDRGALRTPDSSLVDFGVPHGDSSMSRTVSLPAAIAARLILEDKIPQRGVLRPVHPEIYNPVLDELEGLDIVCKDEVTTL